MNPFFFSGKRYKDISRQMVVKIFFQQKCQLQKIQIHLQTY